MKKSIILLFGSAVFLTSCGENANNEVETDETTVLTEQEMQASIHEMDDSLAVLMNEVMVNNSPMNNLAYHEAINRNKEYYSTYPNSDFAPKAVEKISGMYDQIKVYELAAQWRDTLILKYPNYEGVTNAIQLQATSYDIENKLDKAEEYYKMAIKRDDLDTAFKAQIESRLEHMDLSLDELIELRTQEIQ